MKGFVTNLLFYSLHIMFSCFVKLTYNVYGHEFPVQGRNDCVSEQPVVEEEEEQVGRKRRIYGWRKGEERCHLKSGFHDIEENIIPKRWRNKIKMKVWYGTPE